MRANLDFGCYPREPTAAELKRYFHLDDTDQQHNKHRRGVHNRLKFAVQLCTVRFLGRFLDDVSGVPVGAVDAVSKQLDAADASVLFIHQLSRQRLRHIAETALIYCDRQFVANYVRLRFIVPQFVIRGDLRQLRYAKNDH